MLREVRARAGLAYANARAGRSPNPVRCHELVRDVVRGRHGLEVGGPSPRFSRTGRLPVYPFVARLDNVNFAPKTIWEGRIESGETFLYDPRRPTGRQFIAEAAGLGTIEDASYDLVLSSHTLEHSANPLRVLAEWRRVLADDGVLVLVLPHKEGTFDHRRPTTTLEHLLEDERLGTEETDLSHLEEILALHDHDLHPVEEFEARSRRNAENRALHHHVFDTHLAVAMLDRARFELLAVEPGEPCDIVVVARKADGDNSLLLAADATWRRTSPFGLDSAAEQPL